MIIKSIYMLFRRIGKEKLLFLIILLNLIIGYATFIVISQFISGTLNYDRYNKNYDRIYRVQLFMDEKENSIKHTWSVTAALSRKDLVDLPEIEKIVLMHDVGDNNKNGVFLSGNKENQFLTRFGYYADQTVFDIFTFRFIEGEMNKALVEPYSIVLSKDLANRLFPGQLALGKQVYGENKVLFTVTGVYEDIPVRSTWRPVFLIPMKCFTDRTGWKDYENDYLGYSFYTYVLLRSGSDPKSVDRKIYPALKDFMKEHHPYLRPMSKLEINPFFESATAVSLALLSFLSVLILVLSSINYINLQTANASSRFREIGIKKALGFSQNRLWLQFISESMIVTLFAAILGYFLAQACIPSLNRIFNAEIFPPINDSWSLIFIVLGVTLLTGFLSAIHPAYIISSYNPVAALKQKFLTNETNGFGLKRILITMQFAISVFMLIVAFIIYRQTQYMLTRDMGFDSSGVLFSNIVTNKKGPVEGLRQRLLSHPEIKDFCMADYIPFILPGGDDLNWEGGNPDEKVFVRYSNVSYDFVPTFGLKMLTGRNFSREFPGDRNKCLINETATRVFGWKDPLNKRMKLDNKYFEVIGVIKDYIVSSVFSPNEPHVYRLLPDSVISDREYAVSFARGKEKAAMQIVKSEFSQFFPEDVVEFRNIQMLVQNENAVRAFKHFRQITGLIAILTVIISSIGLFGLILFLTQKKMKEIGIRKILGFSAASLYLTLSSDFLKLVIISLAVSWPASYFVYRILPGANKYGIQIWEFLLATVIILIVASATISYQIFRALRVRPTAILKDE